MLDEILPRLFGFRRPRYPLNLEPLPISEPPLLALLSFALSGPDGIPLQPAVKEGDQVKAGQTLADDGVRPVIVSPVSGRVSAIAAAPDLRGAASGLAILIAPAPDSSPRVFPPLVPEKASPEELRLRIEAAGILTDSLSPRPVGDALWPTGGGAVETLIVLAADREPEVASALQSFRERSEDTMAAARMLGRAAGARRVAVAAPAPLEREAKKIAERRQVEIMAVPASYPWTLEPLVALRCGGGVKLVAVETALACLDAVAAGKVQDKKTVTVVGPDGRARANPRVSLGTRLGEVLAAAGLTPAEGDKVVAGGWPRGHAQDSLESAVDPGVDALLLIAAAEIVAWSDEPCINCGACTAVCPVRLQPQLLGRCAESGRFDRAEKFSAMNCIECGLCASVCTGRRPLLQLLRMARSEIQKKRAAGVAETRG